ncbi:MAG: hypothetical protein KCHDKBKB_01736 [Elusimicrobia bacterium]|nr:hypothetical protein [Elusimicrobiota bacterium]
MKHVLVMILTMAATNLFASNATMSWSDEDPRSLEANTPVPPQPEPSMEGHPSPTASPSSTAIPSPTASPSPTILPAPTVEAGSGSKPEKSKSKRSAPAKVSPKKIEVPQLKN